jgi:hypothetical protein
MLPNEPAVTATKRLLFRKHPSPMNRLLPSQREAKGEPCREAEGESCCEAEGEPCCEAEGEPCCEAEGEPCCEAEGELELQSRRRARTAKSKPPKKGPPLAGLFFTSECEP